MSIQPNTPSYSYWMDIIGCFNNVRKIAIHSMGMYEGYKEGFMFVSYLDTKLSLFEKMYEICDFV